MSVPAQFIAGIINGEYDEDLERIRLAIRDRERTVGSMNLYTLAIGQRVRLKGLSPKYLNGLEGEVTEVGRNGSKRVTVKLDRPQLRFGTTVRPPASCVEAV